MYEYQSDWPSALAMARRYDPNSIPQVQIDQAKWHLERKDFENAENCFIQAKAPEHAVDA